MRPLSFTKNIGGLETVHRAICTGYQPGITTRRFRDDCGLSDGLGLAVVEFFLSTQIRDAQEYLLGDTLIAESLRRPYSRLLARLYFFALNLNLPGHRLRPEHQDAGAIQNSVARNLVYVDEGFRVERLDKNTSLMPYVGAVAAFTSERALRKWVNNYYYMAHQCEFVRTPSGVLETFPDTWGPLALRLFFERYAAGAGAVDVSGLVAAARSAELHKIMGTTEEWLEQRLGGAAELFVTNRTATFEGFEETPEEREMAAGRSPLAQPTGVQVRRRYRQMAVILRSNANRAFLLRAYGGRCQLSGAVLRLADGVSMDSAHIQPLGAPHEGPDDVGNMLSLSPTMHRLFDHGAIRVDPENLEIRLLHGNDLPHLPRLSLHPDHRIDVDRLRYHARRIVREHLT